VRYEEQWAKRNILINLADIQYLTKPVRTFLVRFRALSNRSATVDTFCCVISLPNHCDLYPYRRVEHDNFCPLSRPMSSSPGAQSQSRHGWKVRAVQREHSPPLDNDGKSHLMCQIVTSRSDRLCVHSTNITLLAPPSLHDLLLPSIM
jgi:hypothetical protein